MGLLELVDVDLKIPYGEFRSKSSNPDLSFLNDIFVNDKTPLCHESFLKIFNSDESIERISELILSNDQPESFLFILYRSLNTNTEPSLEDKNRIISLVTLLETKLFDNCIAFSILESIRYRLNSPDNHTLVTRSYNYGIEGIELPYGEEIFLSEITSDLASVTRGNGTTIGFLDILDLDFKLNDPSIKLVRDVGKSETHICFVKMSKDGTRPIKNHLVRIKSYEDIFTDKSLDDSLLPYLGSLKYINVPYVNHITGIEFGVNLKELSFELQLILIRFLKTSNNCLKSRFRYSLSHVQDKESFLISFLACSGDPEMIDVILGISSYEESSKLFELFANTINLRYKNDSSKIKQKIFFGLILSRCKGLITTFYDSLQKGIDIDSLLEGVSLDIMYVGFMFKSLLKSNGRLTLKEANEEMKNVNFSVVKCGGLVASEDPIDMLNPDNYNSPEKFSKNDYLKCCEMYEKSYSSLPKEVVQGFISGIGKFLNNENSTCFMAKDDKGNLIGRSGSEYISAEESETLGLYIDQNYGLSGFGEFLLSLSLEECSKSKKITCTTYPHNSGLERHMRFPFYGDGVFDRDFDGFISQDWVSGYYDPSYCVTKDTKIYSDKKIIDMDFPEHEGLVLHRAKSIQEKVSIIKSFLSKGYTLCRSVYDGSIYHVLFKEPIIN